MGLKIFGAGGIDQKSNNLLRDPRNLRDARNVMINISGEYVKRPGTAEDVAFSDVFNDVTFIKSLNTYFYRGIVGGYRAINLDTLSYTIPYMWADPTSDVTSSISVAEYLNTAIFTHEEGQNFTAKYDGRSVYAAGLPAPVVSVSTPGSGYFLLSYLDYIDAKGNNIFGPATITETSSNVPTITFDTMALPFYAGGIVVNTVTAGTLSASNRTITTIGRSPDFDTNDCIGSKVVIREYSPAGGVYSISISDTAVPSAEFGNYSLLLQIESITPTTITFTAASFGTKQIAITGIGAQNILGSYRMRFFMSTSETTGYTGPTAQYNPQVDNSTGTNVFTYPEPVVALPAIGTELLSDLYDITTSKLRPPKCKYVTTYGFQIAYSNVISFYDFQNKETTYTNNDLVMYSDLSTGDLGENLSESNRQLIGDTFDGQITGAIRSKDSLIVTKDKSLYALDGVLLPGQYTMRKIETNQIGCLSEKSLLSVDKIIMFQGQDGIYGVNGYQCKKLSRNLDPFFKTVTDPTLTRAVMNNRYNQYLFWTDAGVVVYDYDNDAWFIWNALDASKGLTVDNEGLIYLFNSTTANILTTALNDNGVAINAYIDTAFHTLDEPGLLKKATDLRIYSFNNLGQTLQLTTYVDWSEAVKSKGPFPCDMSVAATKTLHKSLDIVQHQSFAFRFANNVIDQDLNISGYEVSTTVIQLKDKNVK